MLHPYMSMILQESMQVPPWVTHDNNDNVYTGVTSSTHEVLLSMRALHLKL